MVNITSGFGASCIYATQYKKFSYAMGELAYQDPISLHMRTHLG